MFDAFGMLNTHLNGVNLLAKKGAEINWKWRRIRMLQYPILSRVEIIKASGLPSHLHFLYRLDFSSRWGDLEREIWDKRVITISRAWTWNITTFLNENINVRSLKIIFKRIYWISIDSTISPDQQKKPECNGRTDKHKWRRKKRNA